MDILFTNCSKYSPGKKTYYMKERNITKIKTTTNNIMISSKINNDCSVESKEIAKIRKIVLLMKLYQGSDH